MIWLEFWTSCHSCDSSCHQHSHHLSCNKIQNGDILVPVNAGTPGKWLLKESAYTLVGVNRKGIDSVKKLSVCVVVVMMIWMELCISCRVPVSPTAISIVSFCVNIQSINEFNSNLAAREPDSKWYAVEIIDNRYQTFWYQPTQFIVIRTNQVVRWRRYCAYFVTMWWPVPNENPWSQWLETWHSSSSPRQCRGLLIWVQRVKRWGTGSASLHIFRLLSNPQWRAFTITMPM